MTVLRYQIVSTSSKSAIHKFVVIGIYRNEAHAKVRVNKLHIRLIKNKQHDVFSNGGRNLLLQNLLILL